MKRLKLFFACLLMAVLSIGQVWADYNELYSCDFTSVATHSYTQNKTFTLNEKSWTASVSQVNGGVFYLGCNSNNASKGVLNNNSTFSAIAAALATSDATYNTNKTTAHAYALLFENAYSNVTKVSFGWAGGNNAFQVYLFGNTGSDWVELASTNYATSGASTAGSAEWTGDATNYSGFAIVARPGATSSTATSKTLRAASFAIYETEGGGDPGSTKTDVTDEQLSWSASSATVTLGETPYSLPSLTNTESLVVTYQSTDATVATISNEEGHKGEISIQKAGTTTIKAVYAGSETLNAKTVSYILTVNAAPLTTMDAIFEAATANGSTAKDVNIIFNNWVVSGVGGQTAYVTDGTKGFIIYYSGHGFKEGDILSGTGSFKLKLYNGAAEITAKNSGTITATAGGSATLNVLDADGISALSGINTGSLIKINGTCSVSSGKYYINNSTNTVQLYTTLYSFTSNPPVATKEYNCTGVYVQYNNTKEMMPRKAADIVQLIPAGAPVFNPTSKKFVGSINVELSEESGQDIYYTDDETKKDAPSTTDWTLYENAIPVSSTTTLYAAAWSGSEWSDVVDATYTLATPLTTMAEVQAAATQTYDQFIDVTITNWVVTAVDENDHKRVWIADADNTKGILLYENTGTNGFVAGKKLNGTVLDTKIKAYQGYAELTSLKATDVTVTDLEEAISARTTTIAALSEGRPAEQGTIVKLENVTYNGTAFTDGTNTIAIDTRLYEPTLTSGKKYNLTGVVFYSSATEIVLMPRSAADVVEQASMELTSIELSGTYPTTFETGDDFSHEGMVVTAHYDGADDATVTGLATFSGYDMSTADTYEVIVSYTEGEITKTAKYNITVSDPAPTGDFEELDGELVAGSYLIYEDGSLMLAEISSSRFAYAEQEPDANGIISNPSQYAVWTLAKSGDYWTLYNAKAGKYAAATGASGKAQLMDGNSDDKAKWAVDENLVVTNKYNTDNNVNATLRHNFSGTSNYGFACYSATQGGKPVFYKKADPSYYISATLTGCSSADGNPTKVPQALTEDVVLKYNLTTGYVWPDAITVEVGGVALDPNELDYLWDNTVSPAELTIAKEKVNGNIVVTITAIEKELDNITIAQAPNKVAYETGEFFNPAGLQISLNYNAGGSDVVIYNDDTKANFTFSPDLETALEKTDVKVTITYAGKTVDQAITVTDPVPSSSVVAIIAKMGDDYYAMSTTYNNNAFTAVPVTKDGDDYNVPTDEVKASILWTMNTLGAKAKFQGTDDNYLAKGSGNTDLVYSENEVEWTWSADGYYYYSSGRTFISNGSVFKNYSANNIGETGYSDAPEFIAQANIKVVAVEVHEFVVDPDEAVAFGTVDVDEPVAPKSFNVTLTGITSATVTLSDDAAFSIDKSALDADGTITVTPNTATAGNFSATITLSDDDDLAEDKVINVTMKVVEPKDCDGEDDFNTVSDATGYSSITSTNGWGAVNTAVKTVDEVTYWIMQGKTTSVGVITSPELNNGIGKLTLDYMYPFGETNGVSFKVEIKQNGALVEGKSYTITNATAVQSTVYTETIDNINVEGEFQIVITNLSPSNSTSSKDRFGVGNLCWKNYSAPEPPTKDLIRDGLSDGKWGTLCPKQNVEEVEGAVFYQISYLEEQAGLPYNMVFDEIEGTTLTAGKPYFFIATGEEIRGIKTGDALDVAGDGVNGFYGYIGESSWELPYVADYNPAVDNTFVIYNNSVFRINQSGTLLQSERCYIKINATVPSRTATPKNIARRRITMNVSGTQVATGVGELNASEAPVKMIIDGQLFILRGEKMYNVNGQVVK